MEETKLSPDMEILRIKMMRSAEMIRSGDIKCDVCGQKYRPSGHEKRYKKTCLLCVRKIHRALATSRKKKP